MAIKLFNKDKSKLEQKDTELSNEVNQNRNINLINDDYLHQTIFNKIDETIQYVQYIQNNTEDLIVRTLNLENNQQTQKIAILYLSELSNREWIDNTLLKIITDNFRHSKKGYKDIGEGFDYFKNTVLTLSSVKITNEFKDLFNNLLNGNTILLLEDSNYCFLIESKSTIGRPVEKPTNHITVKGGNEAFNEKMSTNVGLIRKRIKIPQLIVKRYIVGKKSNTNISIMYIKGVAEEELVNEVMKRIEAIESDNILDSEYIISLIEDKQATLFPTIHDTERPDVASANLYEGRVCIIIDGSPFALIVPSLFIQTLQSVEDFFMKRVVATCFRILRFFAFLIALLLPAIYISLIYFHSELLPLNLLLSIAGQRSDVPFPGYFEILIMMLFFDLLREAGTRMPSALGSSLSFLGAIVIGESAVSAGLFSSIIVIIVTVTAICSLAIPNYNLNLTVTIYRYLFVLVSILGGFFGLTIATIALVTHMASIRSYGISYLSPFAPFCAKGMMDSLYRAPIGKIFKRGKNISKEFPH